MRRFRARKDAGNKGFSLVEILVVLLILGILGSIAIPSYMNEKSRSYMATANSDAATIGIEVAQLVSDYTTLGTQAGTITLSATNAIQFDPMLGAINSNGSSTGPGLTTDAVHISAGSTIGSSNWDTSGTAMHWCIEVINSGTYAKFTDKGAGIEGIGTPTGSQLCVAGA